MPQGVATKGKAGQQHNIRGQDDCPDTYPERSFPRHRIREPKRFPDIGREHEDENEREIEKVAVHVLHDERKGTLAEVGLSRCSPYPCTRDGPASFVVSA